MFHIHPNILHEKLVTIVQNYINMILYGKSHLDYNIMSSILLNQYLKYSHRSHDHMTLTWCGVVYKNDKITNSKKMIVIVTKSCVQRL